MRAHVLRTAASLLLFACSFAAWGQVAKDSELFRDLQAQDRTFFENTRKYICATPDRKPIRKTAIGCSGKS